MTGFYFLTSFSVGFLLPQVVLSADSVCGFDSIQFSGDLNEFTANSGVNDWKYDHAIGKDFLSAYHVCQGIQSQQGLSKMPYISYCFYRSAINPLFTDMAIYARGNDLSRVRMSFKESVHSSDIIGQLTKKYGKPTNGATFREEAATRYLIEWRRQYCRVVFDYGGIPTLQSSALVFERLPVFKGGFNPALSRTDVLDGKMP